MRKSAVNLFTGIAMGALICASAPTALAQTAPESADSADNTADQGKEIVVTGTLIKGVAPVGTDVIGISQAAVVTSGASNATDLLRKIPQVGDFNSIPQPTTNGAIPFAPVSLRGIGALSGMATLILIDGKRIVPTSPGQNWIDTQMIPAGAIDHVEVVPDGGSSIYGSDAVGGVINFVTKRKMQGFNVSANYGDGKGSFRYWDATVSAGHVWNSGSAVLSYSYSDRKTLLGKDLNYLVENKTALGGQDNRSISCSPGTISANNTSYALPGKVAGSANYCSAYGDLSFYPAEKRHSVFGTLTQELSDAIKFALNAFWSRRDAKISDPDNARSSGTITNTNPYFSAIAGETTQSVAFSYQNVFGIRENPSTYKAWQVSPSLSMDLAPRWSAKLSFNLGKSDSFFDSYSVNGQAQSDALAATTTAAALNPYNPTASNAAVLKAIADYKTREGSHQELQEARLVFDGSLLDLPGGAVKVALGGELHKEIYQYSQSKGPSTAFSLVNSVDAHRNVSSLFGELYVPVMTNLRVSLSGRYDHYSDVGSTTNPKLGFTYEPSEWLSLRGNWGKSFHAPSLSDLAAPVGYQLFLPISPFRAANSSFFPDFFKPTFLLVGAKAGIKPEKATTWSLGADIKPTQDLKISLTYWNIKYKDRVDQNAGFFFGPGYYADAANAPYFILNPANPQAIVNKFGSFPVQGFPDLQTLFNIFGAPYVVSDQRKQNLGFLNIDGLDFSVAYAADLAGGRARIDLNGTYLFNRDRQTIPGTAVFSTLKDGDFNSPQSRFNGTAAFGWAKGSFDATVTVAHRGSATVGTEKIGSFTTVALFGKYDITKNISASVNVDNLFDTAPPPRYTVNNGVAYIDAGRVVKVGVNLRF